MEIKKIVSKFFFKQKKIKEMPFFTKDIFKDKKYKIGNYTYGHPKVIFENENANLYIGKFCSIAAGVKIFLGGNHRADWITTYPFSHIPNIFPEASNILGHPSTKGDVIIENDVWIGDSAMIMSGVTIGNGAVIGANAVVAKNVGSYEIWAGNPAKFIKKRFSEDEIAMLQQIKWWDRDIEIIRNNVDLLCSDKINLIKTLGNDL